MELNNVICEYAIEHMGNLYFSCYGGNSFYRFDKKADGSYKIGPLIKHPSPELTMSRLYKKVYPVNRKIYLFPWTGESKIDIYNLDTEELSYIDISNYDLGQTNNTEFKICDCLAYGKYLYAIGLNFPAVLKVDTVSDDVKCVIDFRNDKKTEKGRLFLGYGEKKNNVAYIPVLEESAFLQLDLETERTNKVCVSGNFDGFTNMILDMDGNIYLLEKWTNRIVHVKETGEVLATFEVPDCPEKRIDRASYFDCMIREGNGFYLFPVKANHIYYFDFDEKKFEICREFEGIMDREYINNPNKNGRVYGFSHKNHYAIVIEGTTKKWHEINLIDRSFDSFEVKIAKNAIVKMWNYCRESDKKTLNGFMEYIDLLKRYNVDPVKYL